MSETAWDRFQRLPVAARAALFAGAVVVTLEILAAIVAPLGGSSGPGRSVGSSHSVRPEGAGAYARLLARAGHRVVREGRRLDRADLAAAATLIVLDAALEQDEVAAARAFVEAGGRLVVAGPQSAELFGMPPADSMVARAAPVIAAPETAGISEVAAGELPAWSDTGPALPLLMNGNSTFAAAVNVGRGRVVLLADSGPLLNDGLAQADNAAFGLAVAGPSSRPVSFAEAGHGRGGRGLMALPEKWKAALIAGALAAGLALWSAGRRFGPPQEDGRELPPPRRAYVDALAATLVKTKQPDASLEPLRNTARERLRQRATLAPDADEAALRKAANDVGLPPDEAAALFGSVGSDERTMALGRAVARLGGAKW
jgi:hypothetical protein